MNTLIFLVLAGFGAFWLGRKKAYIWQNNNQKLHSLPNYYGLIVLSWSVLPALFLFAIWSFFEDAIILNILISEVVELQNLSASKLGLLMNEVHLLAASNSDFSDGLTGRIMQITHDYMQINLVLKTVLCIVLVAVGFVLSFGYLTPESRARNKVEKLIVWVLFGCAAIAILTTAGILFSVLFESINFFSQIPISEFLFGSHWSPQIAIREGQSGSSGAFGAVPLFWGTLFISFIAMLIASPLGLISAIYLSEYANSKIRAVVKPILEILAGVPTVVYGFFAALTVGPLVRDFGYWLRELGVNLDIHIFANITVSTESALAAGLVMGMMIVPFILSLSDDVISAVPETMRDGSTALGATRSETVWRVIVPAALPGIVGGFLLAISRAIGETMIVLMAAGVAANLTANPLDSVTTVTTQIVVLLTGDQEFDSTKTLAAFALGLGLFIITLLLNIIALQVVKKYREQYE